MARERRLKREPKKRGGPKLVIEGSATSRLIDDPSAPLGKALLIERGPTTVRPMTALEEKWARQAEEAENAMQESLLAEPVIEQGSGPTLLGTIEMPPQIAALPRDGRGFPVIFTVLAPTGAKAKKEKRYDFSEVDPDKMQACFMLRLCGACGAYLVAAPNMKLFSSPIYFIGGPLAVATGIFNDPPMHESCARFAMSVCPWMVMPSRWANAFRTPPEPLLALVKARGYEGDEAQALFKAKFPEVIEWWKPDGGVPSEEEVAQVMADQSKVMAGQITTAIENRVKRNVLLSIARQRQAQANPTEAQTTGEGQVMKEKDNEFELSTTAQAENTSGPAAASGPGTGAAGLDTGVRGDADERGSSSYRSDFFDRLLRRARSLRGTGSTSGDKRSFGPEADDFGPATETQDDSASGSASRGEAGGEAQSDNSGDGPTQTESASHGDSPASAGQDEGQ